MSQLKITPTAIPEVVVFEPPVFGDERGFFQETFRSEWFDALDIKPTFVQDNHSRSSHGILRGLHLQREHTQGKLVRVTQGEVFDVAVDLRLDSPTYGKWVGEVLSSENKKVFWVPEGFAHGFVVLSETAEFLYKCTNYYHPASDLSVAFDDPALAIDWCIDHEKISLSEKDKNGRAFVSGMGFKEGVWQEP
ncbi:MAG: dTDP-4-dehydrorhamnose 3,5-epimerase [Cellvibrionales bacterium]|nr:dTDP-4-dehydrorhamnose 3,5-epimerase [Cellvibrionales bacterium]